MEKREEGYWWVRPSAFTVVQGAERPWEVVRVHDGWLHRGKYLYMTDDATFEWGPYLGKAPCHQVHTIAHQWEERDNGDQACSPCGLVWVPT